MSVLSRRDRVLSALSFEKPDRPPFQISFTEEFANRFSEYNGLLNHRHRSMSGESFILEEYTRQDMLLVAVSWVNGYFSSLDPEFVDDWGVKFRRVEYRTRFGPGSYAEVYTHPLADDSLIESYIAPDPNSKDLYKVAQKVVKQKKESWYLVGCAVTTIFETACALRGMEQLLVDMLLDPDLANAILDIPYKFHKATAEKLTSIGYDMIRLGDDVGGQKGMILSPEMWRTFLKPRLADIITSIKRINRNVSIAYHSDGDIRAIIPELIEIGVDVLNPIQPQSMEPEEIKKSYGDKLVLWGTLDIQHTIPFGTPEMVEKEVQDRITSCGYNGGLILSPTHHVQLDTPIENFEALLNAF